LAYKHKPSRNGDVRSSWLNIQDGGTGIFSSDFGIGENMSLGLTANIIMSVEDKFGNIRILDS
jgi:hypothetical protein